MGVDQRRRRGFPHGRGLEGTLARSFEKCFCVHGFAGDWPLARGVVEGWETGVSFRQRVSFVGRGVGKWFLHHQNQ